MSKVIHLMIAKIDAEKRMVAMDENHPFRSAYEDFLAKVDGVIAQEEKMQLLREKWAAEDLAA